LVPRLWRPGRPVWRAVDGEHDPDGSLTGGRVRFSEAHPAPVTSLRPNHHAPSLPCGAATTTVRQRLPPLHVSSSRNPDRISRPYTLSASTGRSVKNAVDLVVQCPAFAGGGQS